MKTLTIAGLLVATMTTTTIAQHNTVVSPIKAQTINFVKAEQRYLDCLRSSNDGVVMSGLAQVGKMTLTFPTQSFDLLRQEVQELAESGRAAAIRYRAYIIGAIMDNPMMFGEIRDTISSDNDDIFPAAAEVLQHSLLGYSGSR
ncbi:MAG: hypothetical protein ACKVRP_05515 [Bacteroidota bacterium]